MKDNPVTAEVAREFLHYNPETGVLTWRPRADELFATNTAPGPWNARFAGAPAGSKSRYGYIRVHLGGHEYMAHRLAWLIMTGEWPQGDMDHIDHDRSNNRWENLRVVSRAENQQNMSRHRANSSGATGVYRNSRRGKKWIVTIGGGEYIGRFDDFNEAVAARLAAQEARGYHPNHGTAPLPQEPKKETAPNAER